MNTARLSDCHAPPRAERQRLSDQPKVSIAIHDEFVIRLSAPRMRLISTLGTVMQARIASV